MLSVSLTPERLDSLDNYASLCENWHRVEQVTTMCGPPVVAGFQHPLIDIVLYPIEQPAEVCAWRLVRGHVACMGDRLYHGT
jgi:hypothetical protein